MVESRQSTELVDMRSESMTIDPRVMSMNPSPETSNPPSENDFSSCLLASRR